MMVKHIWRWIVGSVQFDISLSNIFFIMLFLEMELEGTAFSYDES